MWLVDIINYSRPKIVNQLIFFTEPGVTMLMLVIFTNIISDSISQDRLINLRNTGTDEPSSIPLAIQTRIANQYHLKCQYQWNLIDTISYPNPDS
jgi:hypothetical protein